MARPLPFNRPTPDETLQRTADAQRAALVHADLAPLVAAREAHTVARLVAEFRAGTLSDQIARSGIAAISEARALLEDLTRTMRHGDVARSHLAQPIRDSQGA